MKIFEIFEIRWKSSHASNIGGLTCFENPSAIYGGIESQIVASEPTPRFSAEDPNTILERGSQHSWTPPPWTEEETTPSRRGSHVCRNPPCFRGRRKCLAQMGFPHTMQPLPFSRKRNPETEEKMLKNNDLGTSMKTNTYLGPRCPKNFQNGLPKSAQKL